MASLNSTDTVLTVNDSAGAELLRNVADPTHSGSDSLLEETATRDGVLHRIPEWYLLSRDDNLLSAETSFIIMNVINCGINPFFLVFGVMLNLVSCVVFVRQGLRERMILTMFSLSLVDAMYLLTFFMHGSYCLISKIWPRYAELGIQLYTRGLGKAFLNTSGLLTLLIAVERCVCVILPHKAARLMRTRTTAILITSSAVLMQLLCAAVPFQIALAHAGPNNTGPLVYIPTQFYVDHAKLFNFLHVAIVMGTLPFINFTVVSVATLVTVVKLKRMIVWRRASSCQQSMQRDRLALIKMLLTVCLIYVLTTAPSVALSIARFILADAIRYHNNVFTVGHVIYYSLAMFNSSSTFFIYITQSSAFRKEFYNLLPCCKPPCCSTSRTA